MKWLINLLLILALALFAVFHINSAGFVLIYLPIKQQISLEMTFWTFLGLSVLVIFLLFVAYKFYSWLIYLFEPKPEKRAFKASKKSNSVVLQAMVNYADADFKQSSSKFKKAFRLTNSAANSLMLFFANLKNADFTNAQKVLDKNFDQYADIKFLGEVYIFLAGGQISQDKKSQIIANLEKNQKNNSLFKELLYKIYKRQSSFFDLLGFLTNCEKLDFLTNSEKNFEIKASIYEITKNFLSSGDFSKAEEFTRLVNANLSFLKEDLNLLNLYCTFLQKSQQEAVLAILIDNVMSDIFVDFLVDAYMSLPAKNVKNQITQLEKWQKKYGKERQILLNKARAQAQAGDFSKAETSYIDLYKQNADVKVAFELAEFFASQNEMQKSLNFLHQAKIFSTKQS